MSPYTLGFDLLNLLKTDDRCGTQLAKMCIDPKFVELTADSVRIIIKYINSLTTLDNLCQSISSSLSADTWLQLTIREGGTGVGAGNCLMQLILYATHRTPHGDSRLVHVMSLWPVKLKVLRPGIVGM